MTEASRTEAARAAVLVRAERESDFAAVEEIHRLAFGRDGEAKLVRALRDRDPRVISLVAEGAARVLGHVLFNPVVIDPPASEQPVGAPAPAIALGPIAVEPTAQRQGIGVLLVRAGLAECAARGERLVFVLGHPTYYPRFGFRPAGPLGFHYKDPSFDRAFFVCELAPGALTGRAGMVRYSPEFDHL